MIGLIAWAAALALALIVAGLLSYGLSGQLRRLRAAIAVASRELEPPLRALRGPATAPGRHSASSVSEP